MALVIRRITIAFLAAAFMGAVLALPAAAKSGTQAVAAKKAKKCKKKKGKKRKCKKRGGGSTSGGGLPGEATPSKPTPPDQPDPPVTPPALHVNDLSVDAGTVLGGTSTTGHVVIDAAAPSGGQVVDLSSSAARASVPSAVLVPAGQTSAGFQVTTASGDPGAATLTASIGASSQTTDLNVVDTASVASVQLARHCLTVGPLDSNRVNLDVPAPEDTVVQLISSDPALTVPGTVTVPQGSTSALFSATAVSTIGSVTVTASLGLSEVSDSAMISDTAQDPTSVDLAFDPENVTVGDTSLATLTLDCETNQDLVFTVSSQAVQLGNSTNVTVPGTVTIPAGKRSVTFAIGTGSAAVGDYSVSATAGELSVTKSLNVTGQPD